MIYFVPWATLNLFSWLAILETFRGWLYIPENTDMTGLITAHRDGEVSSLTRSLNVRQQVIPPRVFLEGAKRPLFNVIIVDEKCAISTAKG